MCIAAIPIILSIAQAGMSFAAASQQADDQNARAESNRRASVAAANDHYAAVNAQTVADRQTTSDKMLATQSKGLREAGTVRAAAAGSGFTGLSVAALEQDHWGQAQRDYGTLAGNYEAQRFHNQMDNEGYYHHTISRINSVPYAANPSPIPYLLSGLGGAMKMGAGA